MANTTTQSFSTVITILQCVGLYHDPNQPKLVKIWSYVLYFSSLSVAILVFINLLVDENMDSMQFIQMVIVLTDGTAGCMKILPFFLKGHKLKECIEFFGSEIFAPANQEEKRITDECIRVCQRNVKIYASVLLLTELSWITLPLFETEQRLPLSVWLPYDVTSGTAIFYGTYFGVVTVCLYFGIAEMLEPLIGGLVYHATGRLKILKHSLQNLAKNLDSCSVVEFRQVFGTLKKCIVHHNDVLTFIREFENCFSWCVFCQIAATAVALCFCSIGLTLVSSIDMGFAMYTSSYFLIASQLLFYCHYGTLLYEENNDLMNAIYMGPWYKYDIKLRKMLIIIVERSKIPLILTAGKVINLTYATFTSVLKTSYSLIAVLNNYS